MNFFDFNSSKLTSFEASEFYSDTFSVDEFIQRKRYSVPLDVLRDDLGLHLKSLRSSLIELINQDYGQFVSLSSNLVGLDGKIQNITGPLARAQSDIETMHQSLQRTLDGLQRELEERRSIRSAQSQLQLLRRAHTCLESSEKYLETCPIEIHTSADFACLQVACDKVADTRQLIQRCLPLPLVIKLQKRCESCRSILLKKLDVLIRAYGNVAITKPSGNSIPVDGDHDPSHTVRSILFMYSQLQSEIQAESIFINDILKPKCDSVLAQKGNIGALLSEIELFIQDSPILQVSRELEGFPWILQNYDFLTRGIFPHLVSILMKQFPHIWSPSTPDFFHSNWLRCSAFIDVVEAALPSLDHLEKFRNSEVLKEFTGKWQFNVYFQLRFHSLAIELESALESLHSTSPLPDYKLDATRVLVKVISQCWDKEKIFIVQLYGRFMKASALFISRYLKEIQDQVASNTKVTLDQLILVSADLTLAELILRQILVEKIEAAMSSISTKATDGDSSSSSSARRNDDPDEPGARFLSMFKWDETKGALEGRLVELTVAQSLAHVASVNEVPRLFRRTNRDVPTKPSEYVNSILQPIEILHQSMKNAKQGDLLERVGPKVGQQVMNRYKAQMDEVLTSVQRMEESLKRLKKVKGQNQNQSTPNGNNETENPKINTTNLSDDDKIRRQIQLDFDYLTEQLKLKFSLL